MMWITKEMQADFDRDIVWIPHATSFNNTLEDVCDALAVIGYQVEIKKVYGCYSNLPQKKV